MVSQPSVPWHDQPAREFPITRWLRKRYGFIVPLALISRYPTTPSEPRIFPASRWALQQALRAGKGV